MHPSSPPTRLPRWGPRLAALLVAYFTYPRYARSSRLAGGRLDAQDGTLIP
jgi:hypothetical protein